MEIADTQAAAANYGMPSTISTVELRYIFLGEARKAVIEKMKEIKTIGDQLSMEESEDDEDNDDEKNDEEEKDNDPYISMNQAFQNVINVGYDEDSEHTSSATIYYINIEKKMEGKEYPVIIKIPVPVTQRTHYEYRGNELQEVLLYEYELLIEIVATGFVEKITSTKSQEEKEENIKRNEPEKEINYYEILGCDEKATSQEINKAAKALAFKYHPDKNNGDDLKLMGFEKEQIGHNLSMIMKAVLNDEIPNKKEDIKVKSYHLYC